MYAARLDRLLCTQILFVEACVAQDRLKPAARAVRVLGLTAEFPNIESLYRQRSLARLVGKRLWQVALSFVGSDVALQVGGLHTTFDVCCAIAWTVFNLWQVGALDCL